MLDLRRGQKESLQKLCQGSALVVELEHKAGMEIDCTCFGLDASGKLSDERYCVFYNQTQTPEGAVCLKKGRAADRVCFHLQLNKLPPAISKLVFTAAIDGTNTMRELTKGCMRILSDEKETARYAYSGQEFTGERAIVVCEIYRRGTEWRLAAVGRGFNGGLAALIESFGGVVEKPKRTSPKSTAPAGVPGTKTARVVGALPAGVEERMKNVMAEVRGDTDYLKSLYQALFAGICLLPQSVQMPVRTVLVSDTSGSMFELYRSGRIQRVIDKMFAFATAMNDSCSMDFWAFAAKSRQFEPVTMENVRTYSFDVAGGFERWMSMLNYQYNNEPEAMRDVMMIYGSSQMPVLVLFLTDGRLQSDWEIEEILIKTSRFPIFWQFIGLHGEEYGILEHLDEIDGRHSSNAAFFKVNDIDDLTDDALYSRLLMIVSGWAEEVRRKKLLERQ